MHLISRCLSFLIKTLVCSYNTLVKRLCKSRFLQLLKELVLVYFLNFQHNFQPLFTRDILTHNIAIKRHCDKKDICEPWISIDQGKAKVSFKRTTNQGTLCFVQNLPWLVIEIHGSKISFYLNFFLSFYRNIVCQNVQCE